MISLKNVDKYYNKGKENEIHVINNISLELPECGIVALFGKSGCGKTTLLNAIGGLSEISKGEILIDGCNISKETDNIRNRHIGYIFQNYCLNLHETVYDNIADALRIAGINDGQEISNRVDSVLKCVGMEKFASRFPNTLSGGQQQRVAIARALVKNPRIILADEPTGNLDEENTILVMELLKSISKNHLVILVTHEANLIEGYCDMVVEISDGSVVATRDNIESVRADVRNNKVIYLSELEKRETLSEVGKVSYYGELSKEQLDIVIVNHQGKMYLKVNAPQIQLLEEYSEVIIKEKAFEENEVKSTNSVQEIIEIEQLCDVEDKKLGKLFGWRNSLISGWKNIAGGIGGNKLLRGFLFLFAVILVLLTAFYGTSVKNILNISNANNANSFYAYVPNEDKANELMESIESSVSGIDSVVFSKEVILGDQDFCIELPRFENSFVQSWDELSMMRFHGTLFPEDLSDESEFICGKTTGLRECEAIITTAVADTIIENSKFSFINGYDSLLSFNAKSIVGDNSFKIVGIVKSEEYAIYLNEKYFADKWYDERFSAFITTGEYYNSTVEKGSAILRINSKDEQQLPAAGDTIMINGNQIAISQVRVVEYSYEDWLSDNKINKKSEEESEYLGFDYIDYYYAEYSKYVFYCRDNRDIVEYDAYKKLIADGSKEAWYISVMELCGQNDYYIASCFKEDNGHYPSQMEIEEAIYVYDDPYIVVEKLLKENNLRYTSKYTYILNDDDYIDFSKGYGKSMGYGIQSDDFGAYVVIHSFEPEVTERYLESVLSGIIVPNLEVNAYTTPNMLYDMEISEYKDEIIASLAVWLTFMCVISLCVYMLMRGNMMKKIGEIGIYRCIGVTRGNLLFRFFVESLVMIGATAGGGHLLTSSLLWILEGSKYSYLTSGAIFYPVWMGLILLVLILGISIIFGLLPVIMLLRKSPSEIISKYDI